MDTSINGNLTKTIRSRFRTWYEFSMLAVTQLGVRATLLCHVIFNFLLNAEPFKHRWHLLLRVPLTFVVNAPQWLHSFAVTLWSFAHWSRNNVAYGYHPHLILSAIFFTHVQPPVSSMGVSPHCYFNHIINFEVDLSRIFHHCAPQFCTVLSCLYVSHWLNHSLDLWEIVCWHTYDFVVQIKNVWIGSHGASIGRYCKTKLVSVASKTTVLTINKKASIAVEKIHVVYFPFLIY